MVNTGRTGCTFLILVLAVWGQLIPTQASNPRQSHGTANRHESCSIWRNANKDRLVHTIKRDASSVIPILSELINRFTDELLVDDVVIDIPRYEGIGNITGKDVDQVLVHYIRDTASLTGIWHAMYEGEVHQSSEFSEEYLQVWNKLERLLCKLQLTTTLSEAQTTLMSERIEALEWYHGFLNLQMDYTRRVRDLTLFYFTEDFLGRLDIDIE